MIRIPWGHGYWQRLLDEAVDAGVTPSRKRRLERHLSECRRCQAELESFRQVRSLLSSLPDPPLPRSFVLTPAMVERVQRPSHRAWRAVSLASQGVALTAAIALGVFVALTILDERSSMPAAPEGSPMASFAASPELAASDQTTVAGGAPTLASPEAVATSGGGLQSPIPTLEPTEVGAAGVTTPQQGGYVGPGVSPETRDTDSIPPEDASSPETERVAPDHRVGAPETLAPPSSAEQLGHRWGIRPLPFAVAAATVTVVALGIAYLARRRTERIP